MARAPTFQLRENLSPDVAGANYSADVSGGFAQIARASEAFGSDIQRIAEQAAQREGQEAAARAIQAGDASPQPDWTVRGAAYNDVMDRSAVTTQRAAMNEEFAKAFATHQDNPAELSKALEAVRAGFRPTGRANVDLEVNANFALQRSNLMAQATANAQRAIEQQGQANFVRDLQTGQETLDQLAAGAPVDAAGGQRVAQGVQQLVMSIARYGPKEAFELAGVKFPPDETRQASLSPAQMQPQIARAVSQARKTWILSQAEKLTTEGARRLFAEEVRQKWQAGDAAFQGLDGADIEQLDRALEAGADRLRTEDRARRIEAGQRARDGIEAFRWGGAVDFDQLEADAKSAGDAGLLAQVQFYKNADPATKGVLSTVYARSLGLLGAEGAGDPTIWVGADGQPVGVGDAAAGAAMAAKIAADPKTFFAGILGDQVQITSGHRTAAQNAALPGASKSSDHMRGKAWDIVVPGLTSAQVVAKLRQAGIPFDQLLDEHNHAHIGFGERMRGQVLVKNGDAWSTPPDVKPGTPAFAAWSATREGFTSDPLKFALGGAKRPAIANVPVLVPEAAFAEGAPAQAWGQALAQRWQLGAALSRTYAVPQRLLTNAERDFYKSQVEADPQRAVALAVATRTAAGPAAALAMMRELGDTQIEASAHLHIADLAAGGSTLFAKTAAEGLALRGDGAKIPDEDLRRINDAFDAQRGGVPVAVMQAARMTAVAAATADHAAGRSREASYYLKGALGATSWNGRVYGGPATLNGAATIVPRWLAPGRADDALEALGRSWSRRGVGAYWSDGKPVTPAQMADVRLQPLDNGKYRFIWPKTGSALRSRDGKVIEYDLDGARDELARVLGPEAVRPLGDD